ncbi:MAG TPA: hypothetical protein P5150_02020, partial [Candidatus Ratteibacteria bacterium]|nr:hypothetical protein [Candidatus Ratteibacteria bacterium]
MGKYEIAVRIVDLSKKEEIEEILKDVSIKYIWSEVYGNFLLFNDKDYEELTRFPKESETLAADLDLDTIVGAMSDSDDNVEKVCRTIMFTPLND